MLRLLLLAVTAASAIYLAKKKGAVGDTPDSTLTEERAIRYTNTINGETCRDQVRDREELLIDKHITFLSVLATATIASTIIYFGTIPVLLMAGAKLLGFGNGQAVLDVDMNTHMDTDYFVRQLDGVPVILHKPIIFIYGKLRNASLRLSRTSSPTVGLIGRAILPWGEMGHQLLVNAVLLGATLSTTAIDETEVQDV